MGQHSRGSWLYDCNCNIHRKINKIKDEFKRSVNKNREIRPINKSYIKGPLWHYANIGFCYERVQISKYPMAIILL